MGQVFVFCWDIHISALLWAGPVEGLEPSLVDKRLALATIPKFLVGSLKGQESFTKSKLAEESCFFFQPVCEGRSMVMGEEMLKISQ